VFEFQLEGQLRLESGFNRAPGRGTGRRVAGPGPRPELSATSITSSLTQAASCRLSLRVPLSHWHCQLGSSFAPVQTSDSEAHWQPEAPSHASGWSGY